MIGVEHPKRVHFFKNIIENLKKEGHEVKVVARSKDITVQLLKAYNIDYDVYGHNYKTLLKPYGVVESDLKLHKIAKKFNPDIFVGKASPYFAHVSKFLRKPYICFSDTEHANIANAITYPFASVIITPSCFRKNLNERKHIKYDGYEELSYLHPDYFKPDPEVLKSENIGEDETFIVVRFVSWGSAHDLQDKGFIDKMELIKELEQLGRVCISSEKPLDRELKKFMITTSPEKIHHLLYYANLYIGESAPMATESAILGTPSIFVSSSRRCYTDELEEKYGLIYNFSNSKRQELGLKKAHELIESKNSKKRWRKKAKKMISIKIDVTKFITDLITRYPESYSEFQRNPVVNSN
ncbi:MAG: DUF354 domain-containing protein [Candidatus Hodarchaeales archaeon]